MQKIIQALTILQQKPKESTKLLNYSYYKNPQFFLNLIQITTNPNILQQWQSISMLGCSISKQQLAQFSMIIFNRFAVVKFKENNSQNYLQICQLFQHLKFILIHTNKTLTNKLKILPALTTAINHLPLTSQCFQQIVNASIQTQTKSSAFVLISALLESDLSDIQILNIIHLVFESLMYIAQEQFNQCINFVKENQMNENPSQNNFMPMINQLHHNFNHANILLIERKLKENNYIVTILKKIVQLIMRIGKKQMKNQQKYRDMTNKLLLDQQFSQYLLAILQIKKYIFNNESQLPSNLHNNTLQVISLVINNENARVMNNAKILKQMNSLKGQTIEIFYLILSLTDKHFNLQHTSQPLMKYVFTLTDHIISDLIILSDFQLWSVISRLNQLQNYEFILANMFEFLSEVVLFADMYTYFETFNIENIIRTTICFLHSSVQEILQFQEGCQDYLQYIGSLYEDCDSQSKSRSIIQYADHNYNTLQAIQCKKSISKFIRRWCRSVMGFTTIFYQVCCDLIILQFYHIKYKHTSTHSITSLHSLQSTQQQQLQQHTRNFELKYSLSQYSNLNCQSLQSTLFGLCLLQPYLQNRWLQIHERFSQLLSMLTNSLQFCMLSEFEQCQVYKFLSTYHQLFAIKQYQLNNYIFIERIFHSNNRNSSSYCQNASTNNITTNNSGVTNNRTTNKITSNLQLVSYELLQQVMLHILGISNNILSQMSQSKSKKQQMQFNLMFLERILNELLIEVENMNNIISLSLIQKILQDNCFIRCMFHMQWGNILLHKMFRRLSKQYQIHNTQNQFNHNQLTGSQFNHTLLTANQFNHTQLTANQFNHTQLTVNLSHIGKIYFTLHILLQLMQKTISNHIGLPYLEFQGELSVFQEEIGQLVTPHIIQIYQHLIDEQDDFELQHQFLIRAYLTNVLLLLVISSHNNYNHISNNYLSNNNISNSNLDHKCPIYKISKTQLNLIQSFIFNILQFYDIFDKETNQLLFSTLYKYLQYIQFQLIQLIHLQKLCKFIKTSLWSQQEQAINQSLIIIQLYFLCDDHFVNYQEEIYYTAEEQAKRNQERISYKNNIKIQFQEIHEVCTKMLLQQVYHRSQDNHNITNQNQGTSNLISSTINSNMISSNTMNSNMSFGNMTNSKENNKMAQKQYEPTTMLRLFTIYLFKPNYSYFDAILHELNNKNLRLASCKYHVYDLNIIIFVLQKLLFYRCSSLHLDLLAFVTHMLFHRSQNKARQQNNDNLEPYQSENIQNKSKKQKQNKQKEEQQNEQKENEENQFEMGKIVETLGETKYHVYDPFEQFVKIILKYSQNIQFQITNEIVLEDSTDKLQTLQEYYVEHPDLMEKVKKICSMRSINNKARVINRVVRL